MDNTAKFAFTQPVRITASGQIGTVIGYNCLVNCEPSWLVRYKTAAGDAVEQWWSQNGLEAAPSGTG